MIQAHTHSKDLKTQKLQSCILKTIGGISKVANNISFVNAELEQNRHAQIITCLDSQYQQLGSNVPPESHLLFGDDVTKKVITIIANKKLLPNKNSFKSSKNLWQFPENPGNHYFTWVSEQKSEWAELLKISQPQQLKQFQVFQTQEKLNTVNCMSFRLNSLIKDLMQDACNLQGGNTKRFGKNW